MDFQGQLKDFAMGPKDGLNVSRVIRQIMKPLERSGKGFRQVSFTSVQDTIKAWPNVPFTDLTLC